MGFNSAFKGLNLNATDVFGLNVICLLFFRPHLEVFYLSGKDFYFLITEEHRINLFIRQAMIR